MTRERAIARMTWLLRGGVALGVAGMTAAMWPAQLADPQFRPTAPAATFHTRPSPRVVIDQGHRNVHTMGGRYRPFAQVLERDGFRVVPGEGRITPEALRDAAVFVTANPLGIKGALQQAANVARLERIVRIEADAFTDEEIAVLSAWVSNGGRALIVADHAPAANAARRLAAAFGVEMTAWWAEDRVHHDEGTSNWTHLVFSRDNGLLGSHPILEGRAATERINRILTFTGTALKPPPGAAILLRLSNSAREYPYRVSREQQGRPAEGLAQAVALAFGSGRVVVIGEAAALTAQRIETPGAPPLLIGINRSDCDNQQFVLNVMHWLMGLS